METRKLKRPGYKDKMKALLDTRTIKPEKYAELREQDFDTWLDAILHDIIERVNFDANEVDALGRAVYHQYIRQSNQLDALKDLFEDLEARINDLSPHTCSNFCGNCSHYQAPTSSVTLPTCKLSGEIIDPDDSGCAMFEPPF